MAKKVDMSILTQAMEGAQHQELQKGSPRTLDPKFPVFSTPVNQDILVYIPRVNMVNGENGETMQLLSTFIHDYKKGQGYGQLRCINGLTPAINPVYEVLGYDGSCPACQGMSEVWELYNRKLSEAARKLGVDPQNDPGNVLKSAKDKIREEMDLKSPEEYVTFPIVIIPTTGKMQPAPDAHKNLVVQFVTWRKKRYEDNILAPLETLMTNPGHPAGMYWVWKFSYNTEGKQANARDSAKNAKYNIITEAQAVEFLKQFTPFCEEAAKEFTNAKAVQVLVANQFLYKEDIDKEVSGIMAKTRSLLEISDVNSVATPQIGGMIGGNPLAGFGGNLGAPASPQTETPATPNAAPSFGDAGGFKFGE